MFCNPLRQKHQISAPKNTERSRSDIIPPTALPEWWIHVSVTVCDCVPAWECIVVVCVCVCHSCSFFFFYETAIILTRGLFTLQESHIQLCFCEIDGETVHYRRQRCITMQILIKAMIRPWDYKCLYLFRDLGKTTISPRFKYITSNF